MHKDYVLGIIERALDDFQHSDHTLMDIHDFVWGKYLDVAEQEKRPLSKLTKDILDQMGINYQSLLQSLKHKHRVFFSYKSHIAGLGSYFSWGDVSIIMR